MASKISLLIDYDNIIKHNNLGRLNQKIHPLPESKYHIGLVLVTPPTQLDILNKIPIGDSRVSYINSEKFVNAIEGYAYLIYDKPNKIAEIMGISGYVMKEVLESILLYIPNDVTLWVGININDPDLLQIAENYVNGGFHNPYVYKSSPLGYVFDNYGLCMFRKNDPDEKTNAYNDVLYVLNQFIDRSEKNCSLTTRLSTSTVRYLKKLSSCGVTWNGSESVSQKELAGSFRVTNADDKLIYDLEIDKDSITTGEEEGVMIVNSRYNFHTHPKEAYERHGVGMGWPSAQDYIGYIGAVIKFKTVLHAVITIEGVYIISLGEHWIDKLDQLDNKTIEYIQKNYDIRHEKGKDINWYLQNINQMSYNGYPLVLLQFLSWDDASSQFTVNYLRDGDNCFVQEETIEEFSRLYK
jgi:hypothetical protein